MPCNPVADLEFYPLLADGSRYPQAVLSMLPTLAASAWSWQADEGSVFLHGGEAFVQGRYALSEALRRAGAGAGRGVLLPSLHCRVMVEAAQVLGARPVFYPMLPDLSPDFSALSLLLERQDTPVAALVLTHYFGFPNAPERVAAVCKRYGVSLIEDCAHALYGKVHGRALGTWGRYAVASPWKFLPLRDGGILLDHRCDDAGERIAQSWLAEAKALAALLQFAWVNRHHALPTPDREALAADTEGAGELSARSGLQYFQPQQMRMAGLRTSRWLARHAAHDWIAARRRAHYRRWLDGVRDLPGVTALFPELPDDIVPCAFPLLLDEPGFHLLKRAGVPLWRWEDMAIADCAVARDYRVRLLQLPCHQSLTEPELDWMIAIVRQVAVRAVKE